MQGLGGRTWSFGGVKQGGGILCRAFRQGRCAGPLADDMEVVDTKRIYWVGLLCRAVVQWVCWT